MFPPHPGGMQPGMPQAHPGMPPNGPHHMGQPMHMAPNVSGPGGPHMAQAAMMGMQPGAGGMPGGMPGPGGGMGMPGQTMGGPGANAMAISHLTPQASLLQQQQQQHAQMQAASKLFLAAILMFFLYHHPITALSLSLLAVLLHPEIFHTLPYAVTWSILY